MSFFFFFKICKVGVSGSPALMQCYLEMLGFWWFGEAND